MVSNRRPWGTKIKRKSNFDISLSAFILVFSIFCFCFECLAYVYKCIYRWDGTDDKKAAIPLCALFPCKSYADATQNTLMGYQQIVYWANTEIDSLPYGGK